MQRNALSLTGFIIFVMYLIVDRFVSIPDLVAIAVVILSGILVVVGELKRRGIL